MMNPQWTPRPSDRFLPAAVLALGLGGTTVSYAPWALAGLVLAAIVVLIAAATQAEPGRLARHSLGVFILMLIPAGLQAYIYYPAFLHDWNPHQTILPLNHAWHTTAVQHYPALLASLTIALAALISSIILVYQHIQQRRAGTPVHWAQVGDHSGQRPLSQDD